MKSKPHIETVYEVLLGTLSALSDRKDPMDVNRAKTIAQVASVAIDAARVEVEYLHVTKQDTSNFLDGMKAPSFTKKLEGQC